MTIKALQTTLLALATTVLAAPAAEAHPHVWVTYETTVVYDKGAISGLEHVWAFDDMYTAMAVQGLDKNNDGKYDREELAELAKVNMDGLKDFDYFTYAQLGTSALKFSGPVDPWLEHANGILRLHFKMPLATPVLAEAAGFNISIYDPSFFIAFEPEKTDAVKLASAPSGCTAAIADTGSDKASADAQKLGGALAQQLGGNALGSGGSGGSGFGVGKTISVTCKKS
jgi:ABC-type uncharacterized transport system substrate-binding protein